MKTDAKKMIPVLACLALWAGTADRMQADDTQSKGKLSESDQSFILEAARGGMAEVQMGEIARTRATNSAVKDFAERMVTDHGKANDDLKTLAEKKGVTLPTEIGDQERQNLDRLNQLSGAEFDREYIDLMHQDHQSDLKKFRDAAEKSDDSDVKDFATRTASVIEQHLDTSKQVQAQVSSGTKEERGEGMDNNTNRDKNTTRERNSNRDDENQSKSTTREKSVTRERGTSRDDDDNTTKRKSSVKKERSTKGGDSSREEESRHSSRD